MWTAAPVDCSFYAYFHMYSFINHHSYRRPHITNQAHFLCTLGHLSKLPLLNADYCRGNHTRMTGGLAVRIGCVLAGVFIHSTSGNVSIQNNACRR